MWFFIIFCKAILLMRVSEGLMTVVPCVNKAFFLKNIVSIIQRHFFAVQLTIYRWDTLSCNKPQCQLQVNLILTQWAVEYQAVMWLMESLHQEIFIPFGWILETSENFSIILLLLDCLLNEQHLSLPRLSHLDMGTWFKLLCACICMPVELTSLLTAEWDSCLLLNCYLFHVCLVYSNLSNKNIISLTFNKNLY